MRKTQLKELFCTFFKIGAFTFGGGYAMIPLIKREVVEEKKWMNEDVMFDIIAIAESTPGPLAVNAATFVGNKMMGLKGGVAATLGVISPSFLIIVTISQILIKIEEWNIVKDAFVGIRAGVLVLIVNALWSMFKKLKKEAFTYTLLLVALCFIWIFKLDTIIVLIISAFLGILWTNYLRKKVQS